MHLDRSFICNYLLENQQVQQAQSEWVIESELPKRFCYYYKLLCVKYKYDQKLCDYPNYRVIQKDC